MIRMLIAGDFCPQDRVATLIEQDDYASVFGDISEYTKQADYSIVNLEAPVVETKVKPVEKCGPNLKCSAKAVEALKYAGFDMVTLANNHFYDYGDEGVKQTLDACEGEGIAVVGGGMNIIEASRIVYKEIKGVKIAFINCCEHEFSIATETSAGSNPLNPIQQYYAIQEAKQNADKILVIVHGGHEMYQLPSPRMKELYRFFIDAGADAVVNHHQHCFSGYEIYDYKPIIYGLGNFSFDRIQFRDNIWNDGYMVMLNIDKENIWIESIPYIQGNEQAGIKVLDERTEFDSKIEALNAIIEDDIKLKKEHEKWMKKTSSGYRLALEPYQGKFLSILYHRNLLPSFLTKRKSLRIFGYIGCESHLDRLRFCVKDSLRGNDKN